MTAPMLAALFERAQVSVPPDGSLPEARRAARVLWCCLTEPGDRIAGALLGAMDPISAYERVFTAGDVSGAAAVAEVEPREIAEGISRWRPRLAPDVIALALAGARRCGARLLTPDDPVWPARLDDLGPYAPLALWVRGDPRVLQADDGAVAFVGARAATPYGEHVAGELAAGAASAGVLVVSGAAYGIDGAAHRAALASGGATAAFLAGGCDRLYPAGHAALLERIAVAGAVVAESPCGTAPTRWRFLARNRLIAAASDATVVVEAGARSGALNTAHHAAAIGRALGAVPGPVTSAASVGTHRLLREDDARCVTSSEEVLELIGRAEPIRLELGEPTSDLSRVRDAMSRRAFRDVATIAARSGLPVAAVEAILGTLLLDAAVEYSAEGWRTASGSGGR